MHIRQRLMSCKLVKRASLNQLSFYSLQFTSGFLSLPFHTDYASAKALFLWAGAFEKVIWWLVEKLAGGILTLAFVIYVLLLCTPKD
jgi:hypothetical protein